MRYFIPYIDTSIHRVVNFKLKININTSRRCVFIDSKKQCVVSYLGSLDGEAGHSVIFKIIPKLQLKVNFICFILL